MTRMGERTWSWARAQAQAIKAVRFEAEFAQTRTLSQSSTLLAQETLSTSALVGHCPLRPFSVFRHHHHNFIIRIVIVTSPLSPTRGRLTFQRSTSAFAKCGRQAIELEELTKTPLASYRCLRLVRSLYFNADFPRVPF